MSIKQYLISYVSGEDITVSQVNTELERLMYLLKSLGDPVEKVELVNNLMLMKWEVRVFGTFLGKPWGVMQSFDTAFLRTTVPFAEDSYERMLHQIHCFLEEQLKEE